MDTEEPEPALPITTVSQIEGTHPNVRRFTTSYSLMKAEPSSPP